MRDRKARRHNGRIRFQQENGNGRGYDNKKPVPKVTVFRCNTCAKGEACKKHLRKARARV